MSVMDKISRQVNGPERVSKELQQCMGKECTLNVKLNATGYIQDLTAAKVLDFQNNTPTIRPKVYKASNQELEADMALAIENSMNDEIAKNTRKRKADETKQKDSNKEQSIERDVEENMWKSEEQKKGSPISSQVSRNYNTMNANTKLTINYLVTGTGSIQNNRSTTKKANNSPPEGGQRKETTSTQVNINNTTRYLIRYFKYYLTYTIHDTNAATQVPKKTQSSSSTPTIRYYHGDFKISRNMLHEQGNTGLSLQLSIHSDYLCQIIILYMRQLQFLNIYV